MLNNWPIKRKRKDIVMKKVRVLIERASDDSFSAYMPDDNGLDYGVIGTGYSASEAIADIKLAYEGMKKHYEDRGKVFEEVDMVFSYDVVSFLEYYGDKFTFAGLAKITGVSAAQLSQYVQGYRNPSKKTAEKIQRGLHAFANDLSQVRFV